MSYIKKKRDSRNYQMVKFFATPPKLIMPRRVDSVHSGELGNIFCACSACRHTRSAPMVQDRS